jgi:hypothetical protein
MGFALADDAYHGLAEAIRSPHLAASASSFKFPLKPGKSDLPVCRRRVPDNSISSAIMTGFSLSEHLYDLGLRCGYKDKVSAYAFRRGCGNALDGMR